MKLEIKKFKMSRYLKKVINTNLVLLTILLAITFLSQSAKDVPFIDYNSMFLVIGTLVRAVFIIFAAVLISKIIIDEYKNKTINIMFMYPIKRKKIMISKLLIVVIFSFTSILLSSIFLDCSMCIINSFTHFLKDTLTINLIVSNSINIALYSAAFAFISLIPVYVGLRRKSVSATIVTGIILTSVLTSGNAGYTLSSIILIPIALAIIGAGISYLSIKDIEKVDIN